MTALEGFRRHPIPGALPRAFELHPYRVLSSMTLKGSKSLAQPNGLGTEKDQRRFFPSAYAKATARQADDADDTDEKRTTTKPARAGDTPYSRGVAPGFRIAPLQGAFLHDPEGVKFPSPAQRAGYRERPTKDFSHRSTLRSFSEGGCAVPCAPLLYPGRCPGLQNCTPSGCFPP